MLKTLKRSVFFTPYLIYKSTYSSAELTEGLPEPVGVVRVLKAVGDVEEPT